MVLLLAVYSSYQESGPKSDHDRVTEIKRETSNQQNISKTKRHILINRVTRHQTSIIHASVRVKSVVNLEIQTIYRILISFSFETFIHLSYRYRPTQALNQCMKFKIRMMQSTVLAVYSCSEIYNNMALQSRSALIALDIHSSIATSVHVDHLYMYIHRTLTF